MNKQKKFDGMQKRSFDFDCEGIRVIDDEKRIVELSFSSETPISRYGASEILSHKKSAVMLERINTTGCLLFNHNRDKVIGKIVKAQIKDSRGIATVQFDSDEESEVIYQKVKNGSLRGVSVGYCVHEYKREVKGKDEDLQVTYTAVKWEPLEISIVSVPADISVGVGRSMDEGNSGGNHNLKLFECRFKINQNRAKQGGKTI